MTLVTLPEQQSVEDADAPLVAQVKAGADGSFERLVARYQRPMYHFAYRFLGNEADADEVVQEVFIRVHRNIGGFEPRAKFSTWIYTIARNLCLNYLRSRRGVEVSLDDEEGGYTNLPSSWGNPEKLQESRELGRAIAEAVTALPVSLRMPVILCKYHGMKYAEAAEIIGCSEGALKLRIFRAKAILAERLAPYLD